MKTSSKIESFEVYFCYYKGQVVYIGKGRKGRHKHCNSGVSHVFELNKIYFTEGADILDVKVIKHCETDKDAMEFEKDSILKFKPKFNTVFTGKNSRGESAKESRSVRVSMKKFPLDKHPKYKGFNYKAYEELVDEFVNHFGYKFDKDEHFKIFGYDHYKHIGADKLRALVRFLRNGHYKLSKPTYKMAFYDCIEELYGIKLENCLVTRGRHIAPYSKC